jgi:hypothetical protein
MNDHDDNMQWCMAMGEVSDDIIDVRCIAQPIVIHVYCVVLCRY